MIEQINEPAYFYQIETEPQSDGLPWYTDIIKYFEDRTFPEYATANARRTIRRLATQEYVGHLLFCFLQQCLTEVSS